jgi:NAD(P)-dependent dehydrogenase (short-subunit alcohol dehydrogenase family)
MTGRVEGRVAIVTGAAAGGIGAAYARGLAKQGAAVVVADLNFEGASVVAKELAHDGLRASAVHLDVTSEDSAQACAEHALATFGGLDILVNNAGLYAEVPKTPLTEVSLELYDTVHRVNVLGPLICTRAVVPHMKANGGGKIVNQASTMAFRPGGLYRISKHALVGLTASLGVELAPYNINVNAIAPGMIASEASYRAAGLVGSDKRRSSYDAIPNARPDRSPADLVGTLLLLASDDGDFINGQTISVDGGMVIRL